MYLNFFGNSFPFFASEIQKALFLFVVYHRFNQLFIQVKSQLTRYLGEDVIIPRLTETELKLELIVRQKDKIALKFVFDVYDE